MRVLILGKNGLKAINLNRKRAIHERCLNCSGWYPKEVMNCNFTDCPLYPYRSGKGKQNAKKRERAIKKYCLWCMAGKRSEISKCVSRTCPLFPYRMKNIDRSVEINSLPKNDQIEALSEEIRWVSKESYS